MLNMRTFKKIFSQRISAPSNTQISLRHLIFLHGKTSRGCISVPQAPGVPPAGTSYSSFYTRFQRFAPESGNLHNRDRETRVLLIWAACGWWSDFVRPIRNTRRQHSHTMHLLVYPSKQKALFLFISRSARRDHYYALRECANGTPLIVSIYEPLYVSRPFNAKSINSSQHKGESRASFGCARRFWHHDRFPSRQFIALLCMNYAPRCNASCFTGVIQSVIANNSRRWELILAI